MNEKTTTTFAQRVRALAERTADAFSWDNYSGYRWTAAVAMLLRRGYSDREAEAILRSKWTRWAADMASSRKGWRYGRTSSSDLARFLDVQARGCASRDAFKQLVAELVAGTFGSSEVLLPTPEQLAQTFLAKLQQEIGADQYAEACRRNDTTDRSAGSCASHDFCDANIVMAAAFEDLSGIAVDVDDDQHLTIWNTASDIARDEMCAQHQRTTTLAAALKACTGAVSVTVRETRTTKGGK